MKKVNPYFLLPVVALALTVGRAYAAGVVAPACTYSASSGNDGCFLAGTKVTTPDRGSVAIESLKVGDQVQSFDLLTNRIVTGKVTKVFKHEATHSILDGIITGPFTICELRLANGNRLYATPNHPIYGITDDGSGFWEVGGLGSTGDPVTVLQQQSQRTGDEYAPYLGTSKIEAFANPQNADVVYNIEVEPKHNYFANGVLVHNK